MSDQQTIDDKIKLLESKLEKKKNFYFDEIKNLIIKSSDFDKTPEIQVNMLSLRHKLIDYLTSDLSKVLTQAKTFLDKAKKSTLIEIKTKYNIKVSTEKEKTIVIEADTRHLKEMIELIEAQMYFIKESIKLLDNLGYALKNNIEIYKFQHGQ